MKPFIPFIPQVTTPNRKISIQEKFIWTSIALLIYLISSQVPLFGILTNSSIDPLYWMRMMMASNKGTLMDLGISPVVTSSMIMQMLVSSSIIKIDSKASENKKMYLNCAQKLIALIMTIGQAIVQVISGFYGETNKLGTATSFLLVFQLIFSGIIIILLDELLSVGYGIGSGVNLFIASNVCENILWKAFSPKVYSTPRGMEFEGSLIALVHSLFTSKNRLSGLYQVFFRKNLPNLFSFTVTLIMLSTIIYLQNVRYEIPIESTKVKGETSKYPIKLLYSSTMPIIVQSYIISHLSTVSRLLFNRFPDFLFVRLLGVWKTNDLGKLIPVSGLCYLIFPPDSFLDILINPFSFISYCLITLLSSAFLSRAWIDINDVNQFSVSQRLKERNMTVKGSRPENDPIILAKIIQPASFMGGLFTGLVCLLSSLFDTIGSGTNLFLAVSVVGQYFEEFVKEELKGSKSHYKFD